MLTCAVPNPNSHPTMDKDLQSQDIFFYEPSLYDMNEAIFPLLSEHGGVFMSESTPSPLQIPTPSATGTPSYGEASWLTEEERTTTTTSTTTCSPASLLYPSCVSTTTLPAAPSASSYYYFGYPMISQAQAHALSPVSMVDMVSPDLVSPNSVSSDLGFMDMFTPKDSTTGYSFRTELSLEGTALSASLQDPHETPATSMISQAHKGMIPDCLADLPMHYHSFPPPRDSNYHQQQRTHSHVDSISPVSALQPSTCSPVYLYGPQGPLGTGSPIQRAESNLGHPDGTVTGDHDDGQSGWSETTSDEDDKDDDYVQETKDEDDDAKMAEQDGIWRTTRLRHQTRLQTLHKEHQEEEEEEEDEEEEEHGYKARNAMDEDGDEDEEDEESDDNDDNLDDDSDDDDFQYSKRSRSTSVPSRKPRKNYSQETTRVLMDWYLSHDGKTPSTIHKTRLAETTHKTTTQISTWFQNARRRYHRKLKQFVTLRSKYPNQVYDYESLAVFLEQSPAYTSVRRPKGRRH